jgi:hypothetical protein
MEQLRASQRPPGAEFTHKHKKGCASKKHPKYGVAAATKLTNNIVPRAEGLANCLVPVRFEL